MAWAYMRTQEDGEFHPERRKPNWRGAGFISIRPRRWRSWAWRRGVSPHRKGTAASHRRPGRRRAGQPASGVTPLAGIGCRNGYWWESRAMPWREC